SIRLEDSSSLLCTIDFPASDIKSLKDAVTDVIIPSPRFKRCPVNYDFCADRKILFSGKYVS
ncbi:MAG TPA: hypothetical protein VJZ27_02505, partial [Aggregatilineales bacterium]|nr:hypothetical protein [Aggregatilineales bacterium]